MSICLSSGFKVIMGLGLVMFLWLLAMLLFMFKQWNNIGVMDCWYWYSLQLIGILLLYICSGFYVGSVMVWIVLEMLWYLGSEFKIGVLWLVEDSVMVCEIWLWWVSSNLSQYKSLCSLSYYGHNHKMGYTSRWKSVYVFVNSNEKWICLGFEFHSGETFPKWRQKWRRVANWLTHLHLEFWYQQTQESGNVYFWWAIILILDREFELAFELNLLAQWFNLLAQWFYLLRGFL